MALVGNSGTDESEANLNIEELMHHEIIQKENITCISMRSSVMPVGVIELKKSKELDEDFLDLVLSIANLLGTTITLQNEV